jgi:hypothetical protein
MPKAFVVVSKLFASSPGHFQAVFAHDPAIFLRESFVFVRGTLVSALSWLRPGWQASRNPHFLFVGA